MFQKNLFFERVSLCLGFFVTFFEKKVTPKNFTTGKVFGLHRALDGRECYVRTNTSVKSF